MKIRSIVTTTFFLAVMKLAALAQPASKARKHVDVEPLRLEEILANATSKADGALADVIAVKPEIPLGPFDVLKGYENEMTLVAQRMSAELASISQAVQANQITRAQADYLIEERYQVAMMQHQVLSALHDSLEHDVTQAAALTRHSGTPAESDAAVAVAPPFASPVGTQ